MRAGAYQEVARSTLARHFAADEIRLDWLIGHDSATLSSAPPVDIAVGPFVSHGKQPDTLSPASLPEQVRDRLHELGLVPNAHPSCLLAIEVSFNGSPKHVLGDIVNASALGLYALVIGQDDSMGKLHRNVDFLRGVVEQASAPDLFQNILLLRPREFELLFVKD